MPDYGFFSWPEVSRGELLRSRREKIRLKIDLNPQIRRGRPSKALKPASNGRRAACVPGLTSSSARLLSVPLQHVGPYQQVREATAKVENEIGWEGKHNKLFWRGSLSVGTQDRQGMLAAAKDHEWSDIKPLVWGVREFHIRQDNDFDYFSKGDSAYSALSLLFFFFSWWRLGVDARPLQMEVPWISRRKHLFW